MCVHAFKSAVTLTCTLSYYIDIFDIFVLIVSRDSEDEDGQG